MKLQIIDSEIAKELKELGFNWPCLWHYIENWNAGLDYILIDELVTQFGRIEKADNHNQEGWYITRYSAPEQALVVKWLRDVHDIHIQINHTDFEDGEYKRHIGYRVNIIFGRKVTGHPYNYILADPELNDKYNGGILRGHGIVFKTFEEAEIEGIKEAIKYLKKNGK